MKDVVIKQSDYAEETTDANEPRMAKQYGPLCPCGCGVRVDRTGVRAVETCTNNGARIVLIGFGARDRELIKILPGDEDQLRNFLTRACYAYAWQKHRATAMPKIVKRAETCGGMKFFLAKVEELRRQRGWRRMETLLYAADNGLPGETVEAVEPEQVEGMFE